jgi:hypothetical protein
MSCSTPSKNLLPDARSARLDRRAILGWAGATLLGASAQAQTQAGATTAPPEIQAELPGARWSGTSRMRFFGFEIYDATLWVAPGFNARAYHEHGLALSLTYLRAFKGRDIAERSVQEMRRQGTLDAALESRWLAAMQTAFPDIQAGERLTGLHLPGAGARFWHQGKSRADVRDPEFSRRFFGIWLAENTSDAQLRSALLQRASA